MRREGRWGGAGRRLTTPHTAGLDSQVVVAQLATATLAAQQQRLVEAMLACEPTHSTGKVLYASVKSNGNLKSSIVT